MGLKKWDIPEQGEPTINVLIRQGSSFSNIANYKRPDEKEWMISLSQTF
jgi:hypothetical protein